MKNPIEALRWRYATKQFEKSAKIGASDWAALCESLVLTPSSFGLQPWKFLVIENEALREKLREVSWGQSQVTDASHYVVFAARDVTGAGEIADWVARLAEINGVDVEALAGLQGMMTGFAEGQSVEKNRHWNEKQIYIALGQLMATAAQMGIDTCPLEGIDAAKYDELLELRESGYHAVVACALGYRSEEDGYASRPKARYRAEEVTKIYR